MCLELGVSYIFYPKNVCDYRTDHLCHINNRVNCLCKMVPLIGEFTDKLNEQKDAKLEEAKQASSKYIQNEVAPEKSHSSHWCGNTITF